MTVVGLLVLWWRSADEQLASSLVAADVQQLTVPLVAGFLLQVLLGAMSYLLPVTMRGGPRSTKAALGIMSRFAVLRVVTYNLALALWVLAEIGSGTSAALFSALTLGTADVTAFGSLSRVVLSLSLLAFAALACFPVLMGLAVRASIRLRGVELPMPAPAGRDGPGGPPAGRERGPVAGPDAARASRGPPPSAATGTAVQDGDPAAAGPSPAAPAPRRAETMDRRALTGGLLGLGAVLGGDRARLRSGPRTGLDPRRRGSGTGTITPTGSTTTIEVSMAEMRFFPDLLEVPRRERAGDRAAQ